MRKPRTTWRFLATPTVLVIYGVSLFAGARTDERDAQKPLPPEIDKAWRKAGADIGWMKDLPPRESSHGFWDPWRKEGDAGAILAFRFPKGTTGDVLAKLPNPGMAFGLDFHCGFETGVKPKDLARLQNLQSVNLGATQLTTEAELKELAGLKDLQALYLFYTYSLSDGVLRELAGLKDLKVLDISHTRVTDVGSKELARLTNLQALNLAETTVTDAVLKDLAKLTNLQSLDLRGTKVTAAGVARLQRELPACKVVIESE